MCSMPDARNSRINYNDVSRVRILKSSVSSILKKILSIEFQSVKIDLVKGLTWRDSTRMSCRHALEYDILRVHAAGSTEKVLS